MYKIPLSVPSIKDNEWYYVKEYLDTEWISSAGKYVNVFEQKISEYTGAKHAVACVNGTSALHVNFRLAGVKPGDEVIQIHCPNQCCCIQWCPTCLGFEPFADALQELQDTSN